MINYELPSTGTVVLDDAARSVTATPPAGFWYRVGQVQVAVALEFFLGGLRGAPPPPPLDFYD